MPPSRPPGRALSRTLGDHPDGRLVLTHYPGGGAQARHAHDHVQVSFLLCGALEETIGRRTYAPLAPSVCVKPVGADHEDRWGARGALILALNLPRLEARALPSPAAQWLGADVGALRGIVRALLGEAMPAASALVATDLLACTAPAGERRRDPVPFWLRQVCEAATEEPDFDIAAAAEQAGVHRVHLSRAFTAYFGVPLSVYRHRMRLARAASAAIRHDFPLAQVAHEAGFADQSHLTRALHGATGVTPARLRRLFSPADARSGRRRR